MALLFGMLGFSIAQHGRAPKLAEAPDFIATTQAGNIAVVECTSDLPDKGDQVATAIRRAEQARRSLDDSSRRRCRREGSGNLISSSLGLRSGTAMPWQKRSYFA